MDLTSIERWKPCLPVDACGTGGAGQKKTCGTGLPFHTKNIRRFLCQNSPKNRKCESDAKDINGGSVVRVCLVFLGKARASIQTFEVGRHLQRFERCNPFDRGLDYSMQWWLASRLLCCRDKAFFTCGTHVKTLMRQLAPARRLKHTKMSGLD